LITDQHRPVVRASRGRRALQWAESKRPPRSQRDARLGRTSSSVVPAFSATTLRAPAAQNRQNRITRAELQAHGVDAVVSGDRHLLDVASSELQVLPLEAEVDKYVGSFVEEVDDDGKRLVVR
jgi:hypothetical protein